MRNHVIYSCGRLPHNWWHFLERIFLQHLLALIYLKSVSQVSRHWSVVLSKSFRYIFRNYARLVTPWKLSLWRSRWWIRVNWSKIASCIFHDYLIVWFVLSFVSFLWLHSFCIHVEQRNLLIPVDKMSKFIHVYCLILSSRYPIFCIIHLFKIFSLNHWYRRCA